MKVYQAVRLVMFFVLTMVTTLLNAEEPKEKQQNFQDKFDNFTNRQQDDFNQFLTQRDQEFVKMLKQNWQEFEQMAPLVRDVQPKPKNVPSVASSQIKISQQKAASTLASPLSEQIIKRVNGNYSTIAQPKRDSVSLSFFGNQVLLPQVKVAKLESNNQQGLTQYWRDSAALNFTRVFAAINQYKISLALSDWALWTLVDQYAVELTTTNNESLALSWFLLNKLGYQSRVAFQDDSLALLMPAVQNVYAVNYYNFDGERYYLLAKFNAKHLSGKITSYQSDYKPSGLKLDLSFTKTIKTTATIKNRKIAFRFIEEEREGEREEEHELTIEYDYQRIRYFSDYPQLDLVHYFQAPVDPITETSLKQIVNVLSGNKTQKLNQLLAVIHQAFPYAIDEQQFGKENYLMLEETLHYQASDCEDRAVLFAWLAKHLLRENVVALNYPGHVSTGIEKAGVIVSADPTYISAKIGQIMPDYINVKAEVIRF